MQKLNLNSNKDERELIIGKMQRMFSSSNINVLLGSAFSLPYLKTLQNIEKCLSEAIESEDKQQEYKMKKDFFEQSIAPIVNVDFNGVNFATKRDFIKVLTDIVSLRETSVVHKIINVFTTNYDNLVENALEQNHIHYFDGFGGRINPKFSTSNYGKIICRQNDLLGRLSEEVCVNLFKIHGSIYWKEQKGEIFYEDFTARINNIASETEQEGFLEKYNELSIVNPEKNKFNSTVLNSNYYDQIRIFANELERQNTILLAFGFSFADEHIMQIIRRALSSNPTLTLLVFPYCKDDLDKFKEKFRFNNNVYCYYYEVDEEQKIENFTLDRMNSLLMEIYDGVK